MLSPHARIAIPELVFYGPLLFLSGFIVFKHGFSKRLGWLMMVIFCILRILGAAFVLAAEKNPSVSNLTAASICQGLGIAPLILVSSGLLQRIHNSIVWSTASKTGVSALKERMFRLVSIISLVGLILGIYGGTRASSSDPAQVASSRKYSQAAIILFAVTFGLVVVQSVLSVAHKRSLVPTELHILWGVLASLPFLLVRLIYGILGTFRVDGLRFSPVFGDPWIYLGMAFIMELIVIIIYAVTGFSTPRMQDHSNTQGGQAAHSKDVELQDSRLEPQELGEAGHYGRGHPTQ